MLTNNPGTSNPGTSSPGSWADLLEARIVMESAAIDQKSEPLPSKKFRWRKRLLLWGTVLVIGGTILGATAKRPALLRPADQFPTKFSEDILAVAEQVDEDFEDQLHQLGYPIAPAAPWHQVARRMSLAMVGNSLSLEEYRAIERIPEQERIAWWTEYLLKERRWADYFAERWTRATVGTNNGPFLVFRRRKYQQWLSDRFLENLPYDQWVRKLLTAQGSWTDAPEVNFLTATMDEGDTSQPDAIRLAGRTSRAFLAMRIDCLQCHQDYLGNVQFTTGDPERPMRTGEQSDFHELAAYFSGIRMENPFRGLRNQSREYRFRYLNDSEETSVQPSVPFERSLCASESADRHALAAWVTHPENKAFARATVNRVWAILFGRPLVRPIDDIPLDGPFPPGMEILADDFSSHGFDLQRLIRILVATRVFQRDSRLAEDVPTQEHEDAWGVFPLTQLRPEQMAASIHQACRLKAIDASSSIISKLELYGGIQDFTRAYGDRGDEEFEEESVTIPQRLLVMNGSFLSERINNNPIMNASTRIAALGRNDVAAIEAAYLSTLNRKPSTEEQSHFAEKLASKKGEARSSELANLFWVLLNSTEFQWNH